VVDDSAFDKWDKQKSEPPRGYAVFCVYRDLGPRRSLRAACRKFYGADFSPGKYRTAQEWSRHWDWVDRGHAWDAHVEREARFAQVDAVREMNRRYITAARAVLTKALQALSTMSPGDIDAGEITRMLETAHKIERLSHGEVTEHTRADVKTEGTAVLEVVERIVTVNPAAQAVAQAAPPPAVAALAPPADAVADAVADGEYADGGDALTLPDTPPPLTGPAT
jgi:hypothetical protein